ncbi:MAG: hypothetical protein JRG96_02455 [Deltaproteobacteria bacterium]|nr:hypothetical protein [Deltaproteobacteria bacterium]MBW2418003.1 hypothetical protein [Deltaproteobacteria bacterium]
MGDRKGLILSLCLALVATPACTAFLVQTREPGESNKTMPEAVAAEYHCDKRPLPFFEIEKSELFPLRAKPGQKLAHRIVYVMCPKRPTEVIAGSLETRIRFKGRSILRDRIEQELKPGRWVIDTFIPLPEQAEPGVYALEVEFASKHGDLEEHSDFLVEEP